MNRFRRLSGPGTSAITIWELHAPWEEVQPLFVRAGSGAPLCPVAGAFYFGRFGPPPGDECLLIIMQMQPLILELHGHGGPALAEWLRGVLLERGWQEDSAALPLVCQAQTLRQVNHLLAQPTAWERWFDEYQSLSHEARLQAIQPLQNTLAGSLLTRAARVMLVGKPNVGKSSLLNALAGFERALVSPLPGTTRDLVEVTIAMDGWPIQLIDTAGQRETDSELEAEGIRRATEQMQSADLVLHLSDAIPDAFPLPSKPPRLMVFTKIDQWSPNATHPFGVSAHTGQGIPELLQRILHELGLADLKLDQPLAYTPALSAWISNTYLTNVDAHDAMLVIGKSLLVNPAE
ncbi:MAG: GTPase [Gemmataceae bacterium]